MPAIDGVRIATAEAGIKYKNRTDLLAMVFDEGTEAAGVFTRSKCPSAPVDLCRANLAGGRRAHPGGQFRQRQRLHRQAGRETTALTAEGGRRGRGLRAQATSSSPPPASSANRSMPARFTHLLQGMVERGRARDAGRDAAQAIMTTDTYPKVATATVKLGGADGDDQRHRQGRRHDRARHGDDAFLRRHRRADRGARAAVPAVGGRRRDSFNAVTVDSDTSTSDTLMLFATGAAAKRGAPRIDDARDPRLAQFRKALDALLKNLALQVVRDGEGARKQVEVTVTGADRRVRPSASRCRSPIRRWSRRRSPARTPIGAASSWPSARPASPPTATACRSGSATTALAFEGERDPGLFRSRDLRLHEGRGYRHQRRSRPRARQGDRLDLRPDQGICRHQRRLPKLTPLATASPTRPTCRPSAASRRPASAPGRRLPSIMTAPGRSG